jgi:hypothetical protein
MKDGKVRSELRFGRGNRKLLDIQEAAEFCDSLGSGGKLPKFALAAPFEAEIARYHFGTNHRPYSAEQAACQPTVDQQCDARYV